MKKTAGIVLMAAGVIVFFAGTASKSKNRILNERFTVEKLHTCSVPVESGSSYTVFFWGRDEEMGMPTNWANLVECGGNSSLFSRVSAQVKKVNWMRCYSISEVY